MYFTKEEYIALYIRARRVAMTTQTMTQTTPDTLTTLDDLLSNSFEETTRFYLERAFENTSFPSSQKSILRGKI